MRHLALIAALLACAASPVAAENRIDGQSPDAPALSAYGPLPVGVRRFDFVNPDQVNVRAINPATPSAPLPRYDRPLTVETWYPAATGASGSTTVDTIMRNGAPIQLEGRAMRDAAAAETGPLPLVLMSHGYPGNRFLMSHLAENLASKGYVVASIDHTDSVYDDIGAFASTLRNRPLDQLFVLDQMARLGGDASSGLAGRIDAGNTGLIGYSMGGYGAVVTAGGGLTEAIVESRYAPPGVLDIHEQGSAAHEALPDERIRTAVTIGPWGMQNGFWDAEGLAGIEIPLLLIAGSDDTVSRYETGVRAIWEGATSVDRALLTFEGGSHNTVAPIPAPAESFAAGVSGHYTDAAFDTVFMNNVGQHFVTAWLDTELKGELDKAAYLDLTANGADGWLGFQEGTADRLRYETLAAGQAVAPVPLPASAGLLVLALGGLGAMRGRRGRRG